MIELALGIVYYLFLKWLTPMVYLLCVAVLLLAASVAMLRWLKTRGARIFETL